MIQFDKKNLNVPNALTLLRIILIAPFLYFFLTGNITWALIVVGLSGLSDALDGFIARRYHQITPLGKLLDPLADKLTPVSYTHLASLAEGGGLPDALRAAAVCLLAALPDFAFGCRKDE